VLAGQVIGQSAEEPGLGEIRAPTSGTVRGVVHVETGDAWDVPAVEIVPDGHEEWAPAREPIGDSPTLEEVLERLADRGIRAGDAFGLAGGDLCDLAGQRSLRHLIINAMESEPFLTAEYRLLLEQGSLLVRTARLLGRLLHVERTVVAADRAKPYLLREARALAHGTPVKVISLHNKYPQGATPLLVHSLLRQEIPYGGTSVNLGALVLDVSAVHAIGAALFLGRPWVSRVMTVSGGAVERPGNYDVPFGTSIRSLAAHVGVRSDVERVVLGGPMTGRAVSSLDVVTTRWTKAVLLLSSGQVRLRQPGPCIRCGWCLEDCPVGLDPPSLLEAVETGRVQDIAGLWPHACLGCGICSYVCPADLPLAEGVARARTRVPASG
jgi:Na+-translocating ferredoxin:NAD+ oxidoreductase subunit C